MGNKNKADIFCVSIELHYLCRQKEINLRRYGSNYD